MPTPIEPEPIVRPEFPTNCSQAFFAKIEGGSRDPLRFVLERVYLIFNSEEDYEPVKDFVVLDQTIPVTLEEFFNEGEVGLFFLNTRELISKEGEIQGPFFETISLPGLKTFVYLDDINSTGRIRLPVDFNNAFGPAKSKALLSSNAKKARFLSWKTAPKLWVRNLGTSFQTLLPFEGVSPDSFLQIAPQGFNQETDLVLYKPTIIDIGGGGKIDAGEEIGFPRIPR